MLVGVEKTDDKMKYYLFKVRDSLGQEYYLLNNMYIGYIGFDSDNMRSHAEYHGCRINDFFIKAKNERVVVLEYGTKNQCYRTYQLFASGHVYGEQEQQFHKWNCESKRFTLDEAKEIVKDFELTFSEDDTLYEVYYLNRNSSECYLREINGTKTIR